MPSGRLVLGGVDVMRLLDAYRRGHTSGDAPRAVGSMRHARPTLLVSACLLGQRVTYRGGSCSQPGHRCTPVGFIVNCLWREHRLVECVPICPEMDLLAMPAPRPPLRLVKESRDEPRRLVTAPPKVSKRLLPAPGMWSDEGCEVRKRLMQRHPRLAEELLVHRLAGIDGCIFKSRSPSCGVRDARLYAAESGGDYEEVDGFFVDGWVRPAAAAPVQGTPSTTALPLPLTTERRLCFGGGAFTPIGAQLDHKDAVLSFVADVLARCEARHRVAASSSSL
ncbi:hypothetical protein TraAM80_06520 [Trypanosoma rangeli]|uniref:Uncharacterized protein n=1 Tax=Trypanosoma rangeli TaxID=5698 RepID=A0A3R7N8M7_TRYRA|nr:uncharacterized protein TraAM80_06520 [Trypanosoma rangeli]RNF02227.1 hypothetical protein TraAM80_06520 [Trypanosoma rangeli]|eukprot:RNF02227.1 hypothetical protein TraAM80_06520 [Trypanosoma rangeli]